MADDEDGGDGTPLGDTPEVHDEIHPADLPPDHPGRPAAERGQAESGGEGDAAA